MRYFLAIFVLIGIALVSILGFRGSKFEKPPLYIFPDMDWQAKFDPQGQNKFFADGRDDRPPVEGTIPRGHGGTELKETLSPDYTYAPALNPALYTGKDEAGEFIKDFPILVNHELMELGRSKFNIFCIVCHGEGGDGNGITKSYGMVATLSYHEDRLRDMAVGEIFNTVTHGKGQMNSYADKLSPHERWATIAYVRALQRSQNASLADVPEQFKAKLQ